MTKIIKIAKLELSILFYSPIAWLVIAIFMVQSGAVFFTALENTEASIAAGYGTSTITRSLFSVTYSGLFQNVQANLYLYLPILTMGLMSRETSSGSIKLLLSSPVRLSQIILGKYLAIIIYCLFLIAVLGVFLVMGVISVQQVDISLVLSGLLGIYLLICTYAAIGLFMSCLTQYQVVAAISTLAVFAVLKYIGTLGQDIDFVRDLTYFLSIAGRVESMIDGLIISRDVFYYIIIIITFLTLCVLVLKGERELKHWTVKAGRYTAVLALALLTVYITSRPAVTAYVDVSADQASTLSKNGQEIARKFDGQVDVTTYVNLLAQNLHLLKPAQTNTDLAKLERYERFIPGMQFHYVYYYAKPEDSLFSTYRFNPVLKGVKDIDSIAKATANTFSLDKDIFIPSAAISKQIDLKPEGFAAVRQLRYKGHASFVRFFNDLSPYASEKEMMASLERLLKKAPKVVFISSNGSRSATGSGDRHYDIIATIKNERGALINQGFDVDTLDINTQKIPANADIVVVADPSVAFSNEAQQQLTGYLNNGGNMLVIGDPNSRDVLNPVLGSLGVRLMPGVLASHNSESPDFVRAELSKSALGMDTTINRLLSANATLALQGVSAIDTTLHSQFQVIPIATSPSDAWNKQGAWDPAKGEIDFDEGKDAKGAFPVLVGLTRNIHNRQQRILVTGDADFIGNAELHRQPARGANEILVQGLFGWLCYDGFPFTPSIIKPQDSKLKIKKAEIHSLGTLCKILIPALIIIAGAVMLLKRRRK